MDGSSKNPLRNVEERLGCPLPASNGETITLMHGEGGRWMRRLIREELLPVFSNIYLDALSDASYLPPISGELVLTTDSYVVSPLFFPGGDIGSLAVYGTVNDLAVSGAEPKWLSLALILEEGLSLQTLRRVLRSVAEAARVAGVTVVTGDTKVVPRGAADQLFVTTTGVGRRINPPLPGPQALVSGDQLLVSGPLGQHGIAVLAAREDFPFDPLPKSDSRPVWDAVASLLQAGIVPRAIRDATRGGVAAVLHEWAAACRLSIEVDEKQIPVTPEVRGACELLGLDPLHVANEGTIVIGVAPESAPAALRILRQLDAYPAAARIGTVTRAQTCPVLVHRLGRAVPLDDPPGAPLPRIC